MVLGWYGQKKKRRKGRGGIREERVEKIPLKLPKFLD